jgi:hypothetical protein
VHLIELNSLIIGEKVRFTQDDGVFKKGEIFQVYARTVDGTRATNYDGKYIDNLADFAGSIEKAEEKRMRSQAYRTGGLSDNDWPI